MTPTWRQGLAFAALLCALAATAAPASAQSGADTCPPPPPRPSAAALRAAQAQASDRGMLWRITKDRRVSHLYATLHVGEWNWAFAGPQLRQALARSDTVALELDIGDPAVRQALTDAWNSRAHSVEPDAELSQRLARLIEAACLRPHTLNAMHPMARVVTLLMLAVSRDGLRPEFGQENMLLREAQQWGLGTASLETAKDQIDLMAPTDKALALALTRQAVEQLENGVARRGAKRLAQAWSSGQLDVIEAYLQWCECVPTAHDLALMQRMNDERNVGMARNIDALHRSGQRVLAAVGALHMSGPKALPLLMRAQGYVVERVPFAKAPRKLSPPQAAGNPAQ